MGGYGRGLQHLANQRERHAFKGSGVRKLWLTLDGDIAKFRILTDGDDIFTHLFHEVKQASSRGREYTKDVLCTRQLDADDEFIDPPEACSLCAAGVAVKPKGVLLVYLEAIAHKQADPEGKWVRTTRGQQVLHVEKVGEVRIWLIRNRMVDMVTDKFYEYGTLLDRYWELKRFGITGQGQVTYVLEGKDPSEPGAECQAAIAELRPLDDIVLEEFGGAPKQAEEVAAAPVSEGGAADTVPPDDEVGF